MAKCMVFCTKSIVIAALGGLTHEMANIKLVAMPRNPFKLWKTDALLF